MEDELPKTHKDIGRLIAEMRHNEYLEKIPEEEVVDLVPMPERRQVVVYLLHLAARSVTKKFNTRNYCSAVLRTFLSPELMAKTTWFSKT